MSRRFPLYAKILLWFFLNLLLLGGALFLLIRDQFRFGFDWMLAAGANERIQGVSEVIVADLNDHPRADWNAVLKRFNEAYQIQFLVYRGDGTQLAGITNALPAEVQARLGEARGPMWFRPGPEEPGPEPPMPDLPDRTRQLRDRSGLGPLPGRGGLRQELLPGLFGQMRGPYPKFMVRTTDPTRYWLIVRAPINDPDRPRARPLNLVVMSHSLSAGGLLFDLKPWLVVGLGAMVLSALLWIPLVRGITRSIAQMNHATRQIAQGRFDVRVDDRRRDELGALGEAINGMAGRLAGFVTGQKRFLGDIAHELCSPLARLQVALGILEQRATEEDKVYVKAACEKAERIASLVNELLSFSKAALGASTIQLRPVSVRDITAQAVARESSEGVQIRVEVADGLRVLAEPELLVRSLSNLLRNAVRYAGPAGPITVTAKREGSAILLAVSDCGPGVPERELAQIFDPFYRLDASRDRATGGVGLGLAIVKTCVESCRGTVTCRNRAPSGLEVTIKLPAAEGPETMTK